MAEPLEDIRSVPQGPPPPGNGHELRERVATLEAPLQYLATKEDIQAIQTLIEKKANETLRWLIGIVAAAGVAIAVAMIRLFI